MRHILMAVVMSSIMFCSPIQSQSTTSKLEIPIVGCTVGDSLFGPMNSKTLKGMYDVMIDSSIFRPTIVGKSDATLSFGFMVAGKEFYKPEWFIEFQMTTLPGGTPDIFSDHSLSDASRNVASHTSQMQELLLLIDDTIRMKLVNPITTNMTRSNFIIGNIMDERATFRISNDTLLTLLKAQFILARNGNQTFKVPSATLNGIRDAYHTMLCKQ